MSSVFYKKAGLYGFIGAAVIAGLAGLLLIFLPEPDALARAALSGNAPPRAALLNALRHDPQNAAYWHALSEGEEPGALKEAAKTIAARLNPGVMTPAAPE